MKYEENSKELLSVGKKLEDAESATFCDEVLINEEKGEYEFTFVSGIGGGGSCVYSVLLNEKQVEQYLN